MYPFFEFVVGDYAALLKAMGLSKADVDAALQKLMGE